MPLRYQRLSSKYQGVARINRSHPLSRGLAFYAAFNDPLMVLRNAVTGNKGNFVTGASSFNMIRDPVHDELVINAFDSTSGNLKIQWDDAGDYARRSLTSITIMWRQYAVSQPAGFTSQLMTDSNNVCGFQNNFFSNAVYYFQTNFATAAWQDTYGFDVETNVWRTMVGRWTAGGAPRITKFDDDGNILEDAFGTVTATTDSLPAMTGRYFLWLNQGYHSFAGHWARLLTDAEVKQAIVQRHELIARPVRRVFFGPSLVNVAITGLSATTALGNVTANTTINRQVALSGFAATSAFGSLSPQLTTSVALSGFAATGNIGTLTAFQKAVVVETYATSGSFPVSVSLDGLANNAAQQSAAIGNFTPEYDDILIRASIVGTGSANGRVDIYTYGAAEGSNFVYTDGATGFNAPFTGTPLNSVFLGSVKVIGANLSISAPMSLASAFYGEPPDSWGLIIVNRTGASLGSGCTVVYNGRWLTFTTQAFASTTQSLSLTGIPPTAQFGQFAVRNASYVAPVKSGYTLARDYAFGAGTVNATVITQSDLDNNFYWYPYPDAVLAAPTPPALVGQGYGLVFDEEFHSLDYGASGAHRWYAYPFSESIPAAGAVSVSNSILNLKFTSGQTNKDTSISTGAYDRSQGQGWYLGYIEALIKWDVQPHATPFIGGVSLPHILGTDFYGLTTEAFQQLGFTSNGSTPTAFTGQSLFETGTSPSYTIADTSTSNTVTAFATTDWHKIGIWWTAGQVKFYLDDVLVTTSTVNSQTDTHKDALALVLSIAWDGVSSAPGVANLFVDWIRVWQAGASNTAALSNDWETVSNAAANRALGSTALQLTATLPTGTTGFNVGTHVTTPSGQPIQSGLAQTIYNQEFGYFESNVLVTKKRSGNPRFYLTPVSGSDPPHITVAQWPNNGTLTTTTSLHQTPTADGSHPAYSNTSASYSTATDAYSAPFDYSLGFHMVGVDWNFGSVTHYVDGVIITSRTLNWVTSTGASAGPAAAVLLMAIGTTFGSDPAATTDFPQTFKVNWLRLWQKNPPPPSTTIVNPPAGPTNLWPTQDMTAFVDNGGITLLNSTAASTGGPATVVRFG